MKILVVDDSRTFRKIARKELETAGYEIVEAADCKEALEKIISTPVNLVTLDVEMPCFDGFETCKKLRSAEFSRLIPWKIESALPIIFVTADDTLEARSKGFNAGAADFITKPFLPGELLSSINRILKPENRYKGLGALVADDSKPIRIIVSQALREMGMTVIEAANGKEAFDIFRDRMKEIDLIVTDYYMPEMDGRELCRKIRADLNHKGVPILFLSALSEREGILELFKAGATDYLIKPFVKEEFLARVKVHLHVRLLNRELHRRVQTLKKLSKLQDDFLTICSHDLRAPLTNIQGFADILLEENLDKEQSDQFLNVIKSSAQFLLSLINDLLELKRIQSDTEDMEMQPLVLCDAARASVNALQYMASVKNIDLELVDHTPEGAKISGDANSLLRIANNLLSNAIKFTPKDGWIKLTIEPHNNREIALSVIDSGMGIPEEKIPHLFEKFSRASQSGTEGEKGTGLGLSIVKQLVTKHGGTIEVSSRVGQGSTFKALFPILSKGQKPALNVERTWEKERGKPAENAGEEIRALPIE